MTIAKDYDLAIIGSGPGGYVAALYASSHHLTVCVIEKDLTGGVCLNRGCVPTKSLINSASIITAIRDSAASGIIAASASLDFAKVISRKAEVVARLRAGIETLFRARKIDLVKGVARFSGRDTIDVSGVGSIRAKNIIIASGSRVAGLAGISCDEKNVLSSDGLLRMEKVPQSLAIIGGGVIGCEFAHVFAALGSRVDIIEITDRIIPTQSRAASKKLESMFKKRGISVHTSSRVDKISGTSPIKIDTSSGKTVEADKVLLSVGRLPDTEDLCLAKAGIGTDKGRIVVDEYLRTAADNVYAAGDCVNGPMLAHKASYDGILACDNILGKKRRADYSNIPSCIWTDPEIASVGMTEEEAKGRYPDARVAKFQFLASGKAYIEGKTEGFVKIVGTPKGEILGVEIMGVLACDLIGEAVLAKTAGISIEEWARTVHGHPTISEVLQEAAYIFCGTPIHSI